MTRHVVSLALLLSMVSIGSGPFTGRARAAGMEEAEAFYREKNITWVVSAEPGGSTDVLTRILAPYLAKEIDARVVVKNMTGGSLEGDNWVYKEAKRDGLTILTEGTMPLLLNDLLRSPGARYRTEDFVFLAGVSPELTVFAVSAKLPHRSLEALRKATGLRVGASSARGYIATAGAITTALLGLDAKVITGYKGMKSVLLAVAQGEMDIVVSSEPDIATAAKGGDIVPLFVVGEEKSPIMPAIPTLRELDVAIPRELADAYKTITTNSRAIAMPPGVPEERASYVRRAFRKMSENKELEGALTRYSGIWRPFIPGEKLQEDINHIKGNQALASQMESILKKHSAVK
jgi:tripartite-type tricarboxylate transporter receptor subunit TctC